jgi:hypothetical protein
MKRIAIALMAVMLGAGAFESVADAKPHRKEVKKVKITQRHKGRVVRQQVVRRGVVRQRVVRRGVVRQRAYNQRVATERYVRRTRPWSRSTTVTRVRRSAPRHRYTSVPRYYRGPRTSLSRWYSHPLYPVFQRSNRIMLVDSYYGSGYRNVNRYYDQGALQILNVYPDGTLDVMFDGQIYRAYSRYSGGHPMLYLGSGGRSGFQFSFRLF